LEESPEYIITADVTEPESPTEPPRYAGFNLRVVAVCIDLLLMLIFVQPVIETMTDALFGPIRIDEMLIHMQGKTQEEVNRQLLSIYKDPKFQARMLFSNIVQIGIMAVFFIGCWGKWGATPGMWLMRVRAVREEDFRPIAYGRAGLRFLGYFAAVIPLCLGLLWMIWDKRKQGWQDKVSRTVVVQLPRKPWSRKTAPSAAGIR
jgi:uncharacterized RDD family membrane protein YckC